eukprot:7385296-Prymnesium_polylepis.1
MLAFYWHAAGHGVVAVGRGVARPNRWATMARNQKSCADYNHVGSKFVLAVALDCALLCARKAAQATERSVRRRDALEDQVVYRDQPGPELKAARP